MSVSDMLSSGSVYAVPTQLVYKRWLAVNQQTDAYQLNNSKQSATLTRTLLITHASDDIQVFVLVPPSTGRFELSVASSSITPGVTKTNSHPNYLIPHLSKPKANFYALPPQATLTCTISFRASQDAAANYQDAVFIYTPHCVAMPFLTIPLLAIARGDTAPTSTFVPPSLAAPANPSPQLFDDYLSQKQQDEEEQGQQKALQQQFKSSSKKATHAPNVFVVNDDDDSNDLNDEEMQSASDDGDDVSAPGSRSSSAAHRPASRSASSNNRQQQQGDLNLSALGQRIAAEAAKAEAEDDMQDVTHSSSSMSSSSRTALTTAGVVRTGLTARLHSSAGGRSTGAQPSSSRGRPPEIGQQQVYQPFQRPTTAEQRHLTEALDSGFVISTESAIDALVEEDMEAEEEEEERKLLQSSQGRPSTAARYNSTQVPTLNITPAILAEENNNHIGKSAEEDEADFYKQILLTARSSATTTASPASASGSSNSRPPRPSSVHRTTSGSSSGGSGSSVSASPPIDNEVQTSSGLQRKLSSDAYQDQAASTASYRPRSSSSSSSSNSSRPVSRSSPPPASAAAAAMMMRSLQISGVGSGVGAAAGEDWQERLAREQEIERRRHQNATTIPNMRMQQDEQPSRPTVTRFPSLKK